VQRRKACRETIPLIEAVVLGTSAQAIAASVCADGSRASVTGVVIQALA
jgi:hypothetical protein